MYYLSIQLRIFNIQVHVEIHPDLQSSHNHFWVTLLNLLKNLWKVENDLMTESHLNEEAQKMAKFKFRPRTTYS